jgi:hypothetical protein
VTTACEDRGVVERCDPTARDRALLERDLRRIKRTVRCCAFDAECDADAAVRR